MNKKLFKQLGKITLIFIGLAVVVYFLSTLIVWLVYGNDSSDSPMLLGFALLLWGWAITFILYIFFIIKDIVKFRKKK